VPTRLPTEEEARQIRRGFNDHADFCRTSLLIRNKAGDKVPLILTPGQAKQQIYIRKQERLGLPVRLCVLKARQVHMSVGSCSQIFKKVAFLPGQQGLVMADILKRTASLYDYCKQFVESYKPYHGLRMLNVLRMVDNELIEFEGGSKLIFSTANDVNSGRAFSIRHFLLSEFAFFRDAAELMRGLLQSVPREPGTTGIIETTANGMGGPFYELWQEQESNWGKMFFGWWEHPEYRVPLHVGPLEFERSLTAEEREMRRLYSLHLDQINWRRYCIKNDCLGSLDTFNQEYPHSPEVAFLTTGRPRFDLRSLERHPIIREPITGDLEMVRVGLKHVPQFIVREDGQGALDVWKRPEPGHFYVIGGDPSKGIDIGEDSGRQDPDYAVLQVLDYATGEQVARFRARMSPYPFAEYTAALAEWYNMAYVVPEANELGYIEALIRVYPMDRIYHRQRDADDRRQATLHEVGWLTTRNSKLQLISQHDRALREMDVIIHDPATIQEHRTFVYMADGTVQGQPGCHDDCVISLALATLGRTQMPRNILDQRAGQSTLQRYGKQQKRRDEDDD